MKRPLRLPAINFCIALIWLSIQQSLVLQAGLYNAYSEATSQLPLANVNVEVKLLCTMAPAEGAPVILTGLNTPYSVYQSVTDSTGNAFFNNLVEGQYSLQVSYPGYATWVTNHLITDNVTIEVLLEDRKYAPRNLTVDDMNLVAQWEPPLSIVLDENFEGSVFPPPEWQSTYQGSVGWFLTNDGAFGYWHIPDHTHYAMTNDGDAGNNNNGCCDFLITPVLNLTDAENYQLEFESYHMGDYGYTSTVEISFDAGQTWSVIYTPSPSNVWKHEIIDLSQYSGINGQDSVWIAFHGNDIGLMSDGWCVDDVRVYSGDIPCQGYAVFLDGSLVGETQLTHWTFNPETINYGQTYVVGVAGKYCSGYSEQDTAIMVSHFLYPPRNLEASLNMVAIILTWIEPLGGDYLITGSIPRSSTTNPAISYSPVVTQRTGNDQPSYMWDVLMIFPTTTAGQTAAVSDGNYIFTAGWNSPVFHKYSLNGNWIEDFTVPGAGYICDFAYENWTFYGANNTGEILKLDLVNQVLSGTIQTGLSNLRHIAFDPTLDGGNGGLWVGSWTDAYKIRLDGSLIQQVSSFNLSSCSGSAFDDNTAGGPYVWYFDQGGNGADIYQFDVLTNQFTGFVQDATTIPGAQPGAVAGGLEFQDNIFTPYATMLGALQQDPNLIFMYDMSNCQCPPAPGLTGYNLYRNDSLIAQLPSSQLEYWDTNMNPGTYCYDISAVYDLAGYGFPGQQAESAKDGPACLGLYFGCILPFFEPWTGGAFELNAWTPGENWVLDGQSGNPAPTAKFKWDPLLSNYSSSLQSWWINALLIDTTVNYHLWLDFDLKLDDFSASGNEKLSVEILRNAAWIPIGEYTNSGNLDWTTEHLDITNPVNHSCFKFRFRAHGENTGDIQYWYIDNIHVYCEYILSPPINLVAVIDGGPPWNDVLLTWQPPMGSGLLLEYILDDNSAENGWAINSGYDAWLGNEFSVSESGVLQSFKIWWQTGSGGSESLTIDIFDASHTLIGTSDPFIPVPEYWMTVDAPDIPFSGTFYAMVHWNMLAGNTHYLGSDQDGPNAALNYGWYYDGAAWAHLSDFGYPPNVFLLRSKALINGDCRILFPVNTMVQQHDTIMPGNALVQSNQSSNGEISTTLYNPNPEAAVLTDLSYNIYRQEYADPYPGSYTTLTEWELIANTTATEYLDLNLLFNNCYFYKVTALYSIGESVPSNVDHECFPFGVKENEVPHFSIYPNPALTLVTVKSTEAIHGYSILNSQGSCVESREVLALNEMEIGVSHFAPGFYTLRLMLDNGMATSHKIVIIR